MISIDARLIVPYIDVSITVEGNKIELGLLDKTQVKELYNTLQSELEYLSRYVEED